MARLVAAQALMFTALFLVYFHLGILCEVHDRGAPMVEGVNDDCTSSQMADWLQESLSQTLITRFLMGRTPVCNHARHFPHNSIWLRYQIRDNPC